MNTNAPILQLRDIRVAFGGIVALDLDHLDLASHPGVASIFMGPNGAGKTTLLNVITGYARSTNGGRIAFREQTDLTGLSRSAIVRRGVVRTFQSPPVFSSLTVREGLLLVARATQHTSWFRHVFALHGSLHAEHSCMRLADTLLKTLDLVEVADRLAGQLQLGSLRRVELARCLAAQPRVLFLDEPTAGADETERLWLTEFLTSGLLELIATLRSDGFCRHGAVTVCVVTHDQRFARDLSKQSPVPPLVQILDQGRLLMSGPLRQVLNDPRVQKVYLGETYGPP